MRIRFLIAAVLFACVWASVSPSQAVILCNNAWMSTATTGTGTITLGSAVSGYQTFADCGVTDGQSVRYRVFDGSAWEVGTGTYTSSGTTLSRTVIESSNSDSAINLSGSATVIITPLTADLPSESIAIDGTVNTASEFFVMEGTALSRYEFAAVEAALALGNISGTIGDSQIAADAVDGGSGGEIADGSIDGEDMAASYAGAGLTETAGSPDTLDCDTPTETAVGCIELATTAEAEAGADTSRAVTAAGVLAAVTGKKPIWIPGGALIPRTTNGCAVADLELATNDIMLRTCNYDATTEEGAGFTIRMPDTWDEGTVSVVFTWAHPSTTTNFTVNWQAACLAVGNDDAMDAALGTGQAVNDTGGTTTDLYVSPETSAITCAGSPSAGDAVYFEFERHPTAPSDTMTVDAYLVGVTVYYTDNAFVEP